jgi:hypothetical protein
LEEISPGPSTAHRSVSGELVLRILRRINDVETKTLEQIRLRNGKYYESINLFEQGERVASEKLLFISFELRDIFSEIPALKAVFYDLIGHMPNC